MKYIYTHDTISGTKEEYLDKVKDDIIHGLHARINKDGCLWIKGDHPIDFIYSDGVKGLEIEPVSMYDRFRALQEGADDNTTCLW